jgi:cell division protein FtsQ
MPRRARSRRALLAVVLAVPVLGGGFLLVRDSPLVSVSHVRVTGVSGPQAGTIDAALEAAARRMTTLDVNIGALRAAVAPFHLVRSVRVSTGFPHTLHIAVEEQLPSAALVVSGARTAVAADGTVLGPALLRGSLPTVQASGAPLVGERVSNYYVQAALTVIGAAPAPLARAVVRGFLAAQGVALELRGGLVAYFGDASRPHAKWLSLARVLADPGSSGASYLDVRLPERPAAGFAAGGGVSPPATASSSTTGPASSAERGRTRESAVAALAEGLGTPGESSTPASTATAPATGTTGPAESGESGGEGHEKEASGEAKGGPSSEAKEGSTSTGG